MFALLRRHKTCNPIHVFHVVQQNMAFVFSNVDILYKIGFSCMTADFYNTKTLLAEVKGRQYL